MKKVDFEYEIVKHEFFFYSQLSERGRRQYAALKAMESGYNGVSLMSEKFSIHKHTIRKGKEELLKEILPPANKIRQQGGGRKKNLVCRWLVRNFIIGLEFFHCWQSDGLQCFMDKFNIEGNTGKAEISFHFGKLSGNKKNVESLSFCKA